MLHTLSRNHIKLHICLKYPYYLNNILTVSTHPKQQQQAEQQPKQQTSQKQEKAPDSNDNADRSSWQAVSEEVRREQAPEPQNCQQ
jgi:hypothetical protein